MPTAPLCPALFRCGTVNAYCLGSRCVKWVPELNHGNGIPEDGGYSSAAITGNGWCCDNTRRAPYADPSAPAKE